MENYLWEGGAKSHENNEKKSYSQGTELEPNQRTFPTFRLETWQHLPSGISELLQIGDCFLFCNGLFIFALLPLSCMVCWGGYYSANYHLCLPFLTYMKNILPSLFMLSTWAFFGQWMWAEALNVLALFDLTSLPFMFLPSTLRRVCLAAMVPLTSVLEWKTHGTYLNLTCSSEQDCCSCPVNL